MNPYPYRGDQAGYHQPYTRRERRAYVRQQQAEAIDWLYCAICAVVIVTLVLLAVAGHAAISAGISP